MAYSCQVFGGASLFPTVIKALFDDPVQGSAPNCCFMSALSAVAWTLGCTKIKIGDNTIPPYNKPPTDPGAYSVWLQPSWFNISGSLSLDFELPVPFQYAHSRTLSMIWPALYEKAYAIKYHAAQAGTCVWPKPPVNWDGNPHSSLGNLSGCQPYTYYKNQNNLGGLGISNYVKPTASIVNVILNRIYNSKTKYPMVAWNPDHCYTVLGQMADGKIVLRDPTLQNIPAGSTIAGTWTIYHNFLWDCRPNINRQLADQNQLDTNLGSGIFAMTQNAAEAYFTNVSYAGPV